MLQKCKIWHFLKIEIFTFFIISPVIFGLQKCTLSQIKALEILFWPYFIIFSPQINICWAIMSRKCIGFSSLRSIAQASSYWFLCCVVLFVVVWHFLKNSAITVQCEAIFLTIFKSLSGKGVKLLGRFRWHVEIFSSWKIQK